MKTIHKYAVTNKLFLAPKDFKPLFFGRQGTDYFVWAEVDTAADQVPFHIALFGTGEEIPQNRRYIGSVVADPYVWHAYWGRA